MTVPASPDDITPEWMTHALQAHHPGAVVRSVQVVLRDDGTNRRARLCLTYARGSGPGSVFVKTADPAHRDLIRMTSGMFHESRLFASGVDLAVEHPLVYATGVDESYYDFVLVMEDLSDRDATPRDALTPLTIAQATSGVRALAALHSRFMGPRVDDARLDWLEPFIAFDGLQYAPLPSALAHLAADTSPRVLSMTIDELVEGLWRPYVGTLTTAPQQTLLHGDAHVGNTYVTADDRLGFLDWQMARRGNWSLDLGYFLQGALTTADRREHEGDLLDSYRDALALPSGEIPSRDEIWTRYRASVAHGLAVWLATASAGGVLWQRVEVAVTLAQRYAYAFGDLDTPSAVASLTSV